MRINLGNQFETFEVVFTITQRTQKSMRQITAPRLMLEGHFMQLMEQAANSSTPISIKMERREIIWDNFEQKTKTIPNYVEFKNNSYLKWERETNGNV